MNEDEVKTFIKENKNCLPLSFNELTFRRYDQSDIASKSVDFKNYRDKNFNIIKFYKPITRFK